MTVEIPKGLNLEPSKRHVMSAIREEVAKRFCISHEKSDTLSSLAQYELIIYNTEEADRLIGAVREFDRLTASDIFSSIVSNTEKAMKKRLAQLIQAPSQKT